MKYDSEGNGTLLTWRIFFERKNTGSKLEILETANTSENAVKAARAKLPGWVVVGCTRP